MLLLQGETVTADNDGVGVDDNRDTPKRKRRKDRLTVKMDPRVINALRDYVYWTRGATLAGETEEALREFLARKCAVRRRFLTREGEVIERAPGEPYPEREEELRPGAPPG